MIERDSLSRSMAFVGPDGIGKRMMALELAQALLCATRNQCGTCLHCQKCKKNLHPDIEIIEPDGLQIKVDQVRQVAEKLHFRPFEGAVRVLIVDRADSLRDEAANAFLKSLEEPPEYVHFVLVTSDWNSLLPTIRSRCQRIAFQGLRIDDKIQILESRGIESDLATRLASISLRRLETDEEAWLLFEKHADMVLSFMERSAEEKGVPGQLANLARDKAELPGFLDVMLLVLREGARVSYKMELEPPLTGFGERIQSLCQVVDAKHWRQAWEACGSFCAKRRTNPNTALWFDFFSTNELGNLEGAKAEFKARVQRGQ